MDNLLILFVKYPDPGRVKTRLGEEIGFYKAARIYETLVTELLQDLAPGNYELVICVDPAKQISSYAQRFGSQYVYWLQEGQDLGERMAGAFHRAFKEGFARVLLMGSDVPLMDDKGISDFFHALDSSEMVIGPAEDGGYYLIGFQNGAEFDPVFHDIPWSSSVVFEKTMKMAQGLNCTVEKTWFDIDTVRELGIYHQLIKTDKTFSDIRHESLIQYCYSSENTD